MVNLIKEWYQMNRMLQKSVDEVQVFKKQLFLKQIEYVSTHIPFYRNHFKDNGLEYKDFKNLDSIRLLPIIDKRFVADHLSEFINPSYDKDKLNTSFTSGSTGIPFTSYFDKQTWIRKKYLSKLRARRYCGLSFTDKIVIINSEYNEKNEQKNNNVKSNTPWLKTRYLSTLMDPEEALSQILEFQPTVLYGPHGFIFQIAELYKEGNYQNELNLKAIFTSSELLSSPAIQFIKSVFNAPVFDIYGSTEFKEVSWECPSKKGYHINEDEVHVEILDKNDVPLVNGIGSIILSDLRNKAFPLLRYRIQDYGLMIPETCDCGCPFKLMSPKGGRAADFLLSPSGKKISPYLVEKAIEALDGIRQFQVVQTSLQELQVKVIVEALENERINKEIINSLQLHIPENFTIDVEFVKHLELEENGKFKLIKSLINN
jgi:phenylacetate-CoA ligase